MYGQSDKMKTIGGQYQYPFITMALFIVFHLSLKFRLNGSLGKNLSVVQLNTVHNLLYLKIFCNNNMRHM